MATTEPERSVQPLRQFLRRCTMVAMGMRKQDSSHPAATDRRNQGSFMRTVFRSGVDQGNLMMPHEKTVRAGKGIRGGVGGRDPGDARGNGNCLAGSGNEFGVEGKG